MKKDLLVLSNKSFFLLLSVLKRRQNWSQKKASYLHHTATTIYLCFVPDLEDSTGASCVGLASCKDTIFSYFDNYFAMIFNATLF